MPGLLEMLGKGGASKGAPAPAKEADPKTMAAESFIEAVQSGDASAVASAFQSMYDACSGMKGAMPSYEEEAAE